MTSVSVPLPDASAADEWRVVTPPRSPLRTHGDGGGFKIAVTWPMADCATAQIEDLAQHRRLAAQLEAIGVDYVVVPEHTSGAGTPDTPGAWPANLRGVQIILATSTLGVVTALRTSYVHPTHLARTGSHLDWLSAGRWGAWIDPVRTDAEDRLFGRSPELGAPLERAAAALDAMSTIWRTPRGTPLDIEDQHFRIRGRVKYPQVIQTEPFVFMSEPGIDALHLAANVADHYVASSASLAELLTVARQAQEAGRHAQRRSPLWVLARVSVGRDDMTPAEHDGALQVGGDTSEVALALADLVGLPNVGGVLLDLPDWSEQAVHDLGFVFDRLRAMDLWTSSADRGFTW